MSRVLRIALVALVALAFVGPARAQRLPADTLHALVARMHANDIIGGSLRDRLDADVAAGRITLRSTLARRQHDARIEALTGVRPMPFGGPMMGFDGATGPTQAEWNERFVRSGLVTAAQARQALTAMMARPGAPPRDSLLRVRTPVPFLGSLYEGLVAAAERQHPDRIAAWAGEMEAAGLTLSGARARLLDSARVRFLGPGDYAAALAPRWAPPGRDTLTAEGLAAHLDDLHRWLAARGLLGGPERPPSVDTTRRATSWGRDETRDVVGVVAVLTESGRAYRSNPFSSIVRRGEAARFAAPDQYGDAFNRMLRDRRSDVRLARLPDGSVLALTRAQARAVAWMQSPERALRTVLATLPDSTRRSLLLYLPDSTRRIVLTADPDSAAFATVSAAERPARPPRIDREEDDHLLEPPITIGLAPDNGAYRSSRVDTLVARLREVGWFAHTGLRAEVFYEQDIRGSSLFTVVFVGQKWELGDGEHAFGTPYGDILPWLAQFSRGGFAPTDIVDRFGTVPGADSAYVSWTAEGRPTRINFKQNLGDFYDENAVRAIVRAANTAARGGRFVYVPGGYAYVWLPEGTEAALSAEGIVFEAP